MEIGDTVIREFYGKFMPLIVTDITPDKIICGDRVFLKETKGEIDLELGCDGIRAYWMVASFEHFWGYLSPTWAGKFLDAWCSKVRRSRLVHLKKVAASLTEHREVLLNYFRAKKTISGGVIEGLNNKVKVTFRKSYGFRTDKAREIALFHVLVKLPEPEITHGFF